MINILKQLRLDYRIKVGYGAAFLLLLVSYLLTWYANQELITQSKLVTHSNTTITHMEDLASYVKDAETSVRGYIIMKDENYLTPFYDSRKMVNNTFYLLENDTKDNTSQQILLYTAKSLIDRKYDRLSEGIGLVKEDKIKLSDSIWKTHTEGKILMDSIRGVIGKMKTKEQELFTARNNELHTGYVSMNIIIVTSLILAFLFAIFGFITYIRENRARKTADKKVTEYQDQLKSRIEELGIANKELIQMRHTEKFAATGRIARTIAHEVRNPLTNIDLAASQLKTDIGNPDENSTMLFDMISRNSKRINQLITELLNTTRFLDLSFENFSINVILDEALELAKDRIELNHIRIEKNYADHLCDIAVDQNKIRIAFLNIIVNAIEAMEPDKGILQLITRDEDNKCVVEIHDNGIGMDAVTISKLFEPYFTTKTKGNGLGLANTQNIILNHKGIIHVESTPGIGSIFIIKFDFATAE
ncbi:MAG TPA: CHASE3 domain-containing protein [Ferruginibacter sp.]|jgi:signal transduction histidine kinase|nr:CHASE3 domain-containing protein [Ferruginibacter sp.]